MGRTAGAGVVVMWADSKKPVISKAPMVLGTMVKVVCLIQRDWLSVAGPLRELCEGLFDADLIASYYFHTIRVLILTERKIINGTAQLPEVH